MIAPPDNIIAEAVAYARLSPCQKSKRGVAIFNVLDTRAALATGVNHPPAPQGCDGSTACRADCGRRCVHAEMDALLMIGPVIGAAALIRQLGGSSDVHLDRCELVHVKVENGELVPGGGPSCWQCSRLVQALGIAAVWLYERIPARFERDGIAGIRPAHGEWRRYDAEEFHRVTCENAKGGAVYLCP